MSSSEDELFDIDWGASNVFDCFDYVDPYVLSPQIQAVLENDIVGLRRLLQEGKSVNINDNKGNTPLHHAVQSQGNLTSIFNCLIELEDIRLDAANFNGETPLMLALKNAYYVRKLLQKGADPNLRYPNGDSLLHKATDVGVVRLLLEHGADINAQNFNGETPLFHACQQKEIELVHLYLYHGADVSISDNCGLLAFDICPESVDSLFYLTFDEHTEGTEVTSEVLDVVYHEFGFCEFYRTLLNIAKIRNHCCKFDSYAGRNFMAFFTYDLNLSIDMVERFPKENLEAQCFAKLLKFFNVIKYKDKFPHLFEMFSRKLGVSAVPSLVELSRNAARKFIISKLKVEDNVQFLTVVNHLPVPNVVKQIIIYQKEIYNI
ncbi:Ankyrin repeat and SOCS box protein 2-like Protein [Tribolium castaneum]|uniref:Ankyrin repeat and SOCS box protein 2-like Protein n=1 Tax=Tribolium castaneum TaxID=7070 RepID=D6WW02_TRICA|nr:Ankyrin repeat and SOCS box protein 2-like Protein [Tribolium castaneum]